MSDEVEEWRAVVGFEGRYEVSDLGRVRSLDVLTRRGGGGAEDIRPGKVRKLHLMKSGYQHVNLKRDGVGLGQYVHRLVAAAFLGESRNLEVNHKDGNKANNILSNLEYCTRQENVDHSIRIGIFHRNHTWPRSKGGSNPNSKITENEAFKVCEMLACGFGGRQIARMTGIGIGIVEKISCGKTWAHIPRKFPWQKIAQEFPSQPKGDKKWAS